MTTNEIDKFVKGRRLLTVNVFQPGTIDYILDAGLPMLLLVSPGGVSDSDKAVFEKIAKKFLGKVVAVTLATSLPWEVKMCDILALNGIQKPVVRILNMPEHASHIHDSTTQSRAVIKHGLKYKPQGSDEEVISESAISTFVNDYLAGKTHTYVRSEPEPENIRDAYVPGSILVNAVGSNFDKLVVDDFKRDVLVVYYAAFCGHCTRLAPIIRELGTKLSHLGKTMKIVRIDAHVNEIRNMEIPGYPTIILYKASDRRIDNINDRDHAEYSGDRTLNSFIEFLHAHAKQPFDENKPPSSSSENNAIYVEEL
jgi:thiol-disulfide isomerase/thioredoxin